MSIWEVILLAVVLAMDACAVAMSNGMCDVKMRVRKALLIGAFFGFFQFLMPLIGYSITEVVTEAFVGVFKKISAWVSFGILAFLGGRMVWGSWKELRESDDENDEMTGVCPYPRQTLTLKKLTMQAIATSIDALAIGVSLYAATLSESGLAGGVWGATGIIGVITFGLSVGAVYIGKMFGNKLADKAEFFGGLVLIGIGIKLFIEGFIIALF